MAEPTVKTVEDEVFEEFGISDPEEQKAVRIRAASQELAKRKTKVVPQPEPKKERNLW